MIRSDDFHREQYYSNLCIGKQPRDDLRIFATVTIDGRFIFGCNFIGRYTFYYFNMLKPEVYAIDCDPPYIPLSINDIDILMDTLINDNMWNEIIKRFEYWIESPDEGCEEDYKNSSISSIPSIPPDYHLIFKNGYTGNESLDMITHDDIY